MLVIIIYSKIQFSKTIPFNGLLSIGTYPENAIVCNLTRKHCSPHLDDILFKRFIY